MNRVFLMTSAGTPLDAVSAALDGFLEDVRRTVRNPDVSDMLLAHRHVLLALAGRKEALAAMDAAGHTPARLAEKVRHYRAGHALPPDGAGGGRAAGRRPRGRRAGARHRGAGPARRDALLPHRLRVGSLDGARAGAPLPRHDRRGAGRPARRARHAAGSPGPGRRGLPGQPRREPPAARGRAVVPAGPGRGRRRPFWSGRCGCSAARPRPAIIRRSSDP